MHPAALALLLGLALAGQAGAQIITAARYGDPTTRYGHGVIGGDAEWGSLTVTVTTDGVPRAHRIELPQELVFEDTAPRLWDVTGDGTPEVVVVQSHLVKGARLAIVGLDAAAPALVAATPFIGQRNRWLAPVGAADLDGDGTVEVAFVDRPHLDRTLRIWRFEADDFREVAQTKGFTNHRIGDSEIFGGIRHCAAGPELILASADWTELHALRMTPETELISRLVATGTRPADISRALACD